MAIIKSINENYRKLPDEKFWTPDKYNKLQFNEISWTAFSLDKYAKLIPEFKDEDEIRSFLLKEWKAIQDLDGLRILIIRTFQYSENLFNEIQYSLWKEFDNRKIPWLYLYYLPNEVFLSPTSGISENIFKRFFRSDIAKINRQMSKTRGIHILLNYILLESVPLKTQDQFVKQSKVKLKKLENWKNRLAKSKMWDEDEEIIDVAHARILRNHFTVNSNFNRSGKIIITNKKMVFTRRSFGFFGLSLAALIPLFIFVRPANKIILIGRTLAQYLRAPFTIAKPILRGIIPALGGIFVSISFINFDAIKLALNTFFQQFPSLNFIGFSLNFVIENPYSLPSFAGIFAGLRLGFLRIFFRRDRLIVIPHNQLNFLLSDSGILIGRWKVKGSNLVKADKGVEYRIRLRSYNRDENIDDFSLSNSFFVQMMLNNQLGITPPVNSN